jgi:glycosyltransferase involved in cell wall biosynthesis
VGWYGSPDNHAYLSGIADVFRRIHQEFKEVVRFAVISSDKFTCGDVPFTWIPWQPERELLDLLTFDIGIMPLTDDEWARGKSGNKALYYMAAGIPPVVSPVGVNANIVRDGHNGLWAKTPEEWYAALTSLMRSTRLRTKLGRNALSTIRESYSRESALAAITTLISQISTSGHDASRGVTPISHTRLFTRS